MHKTQNEGRLSFSIVKYIISCMLSQKKPKPVYSRILWFQRDTLAGFVNVDTLEHRKSEKKWAENVKKEVPLSSELSEKWSELSERTLK